MNFKFETYKTKLTYLPDPMVLFYKIIYSSVINLILRTLNKFLIKVVDVVKLPPSGTLTIKVNGGKRLKFKTNQTDFVGFSIFWDGIYNYEFVYLFEKISKKLNGFIDIGSNAGLYSLIAALSSDKVKILSFDPTEAANFYITENIRINQIENRIHVCQLALSDKTEILDFFEVKNPKYPYLKYNLGGSSSLVNHPKEYTIVPVQAYSFDEFIQENPQFNFQIDFIKIDAEGAEPAILSGMKHTIDSQKPIIVCEILSASVGYQIEKFFQSLGYRFFLNKGRNLIPISAIKENTNGSRVYNYFLVHPTKMELILEFTTTDPIILEN
jgi:FkbM family methyltransferase